MVQPLREMCVCPQRCMQQPQLYTFQSLLNPQGRPAPCPQQPSRLVERSGSKAVRRDPPPLHVAQNQRRCLHLAQLPERCACQSPRLLPFRGWFHKCQAVGLRETGRRIYSLIPPTECLPMRSSRPSAKSLRAPSMITVLRVRQRVIPLRNTVAAVSQPPPSWLCSREVAQ